MSSIATETVTVTRESVDNALVALMAAERYFEQMAGGVSPAPWGIFDESIIELFKSAHGDESMFSDTDDGDFSPLYEDLDERARDESNAFLRSLQQRGNYA